MLMRSDKWLRFDLGYRVEAARGGAARTVDVAGQTCIDPGREIDAAISLSYCPNRPRPEIAIRRLRVLYEDEHILIVDKPAGVLTQPTPERERDTRPGACRGAIRRAAGVSSGLMWALCIGLTGIHRLFCWSVRPVISGHFNRCFARTQSKRSYVASLRAPSKMRVRYD